MDFRTQVYERYNSARQRHSAPTSVEGLQARLPYLGRFVERHFPSDRSSRILDIGCGYGAILDAARRAGYTELRGVDPSPEQVASAQALAIDGVALGDGMEDLRSHGDGSVDVVITFDVIEHLTTPELFEMSAEIRRVLSDRGCWLIHTVNGASPFFGAVRYGDLTHHEAFTDVSLSQLVLSTGFSKLDAFEDEPAPHGVFSVVRLVLWRTIRSVLRLVVATETGSMDRGILSRNLVAVAYK